MRLHSFHLYFEAPHSIQKLRLCNRRSSLFFWGFHNKIIDRWIPINDSNVNLSSDRTTASVEAHVSLFKRLPSEFTVSNWLNKTDTAAFWSEFIQHVDSMPSRLTCVSLHKHIRMHSILCLSVNRLESDFLIYSTHLSASNGVNSNSMYAHTSSVGDVPDMRTPWEERWIKEMEMCDETMWLRHAFQWVRIIVLEIVDKNLFFFSLAFHSPINTGADTRSDNSNNLFHFSHSFNRVQLTSISSQCFLVSHRSAHTRTHTGLWINLEPDRRKKKREPLPSSAHWVMPSLQCIASHLSFIWFFTKLTTFGRSEQDTISMLLLLLLFSVSLLLFGIYLFVERFVLHLKWRARICGHCVCVCVRVNG